MAPTKNDMDLINSRLMKLEELASKLKTLAYVALTLAGIFGIGGAWGYTLLNSVRDKIHRANAESSALSDRLVKLQNNFDILERTYQILAKNQANPNQQKKNDQSVTKPKSSTKGELDTVAEKKKPPINVELGTIPDLCGGGSGEKTMLCFVETGSIGEAKVTLASILGSWPPLSSLASATAVKDKAKGIYVAATFEWAPAHGSKFFVAIDQPSRTQDSPRVVPGR